MQDGGKNCTNAAPLLPERARSECARSASAVGPAPVPFQERETSELEGTIYFDARSEGQSWPLPLGQEKNRTTENQPGYP